MYFWAGVSFTALGGQTANFLQRAAKSHYKLRNIRPILGGVSAQCGAKQYITLHRLAKVCHVRLQLHKRHGLYFYLRTVLLKKGLLVGGCVFFILFVLQQNLIWKMDYGTLSVGQQARIAKILWESCNIAPGAYTSEELLAAGEAELLSTAEEFSWVSLNFTGGRLTIEATAASVVPEIAQGSSTDTYAKIDGEIVQVNVQQGTPMVSVGDLVEMGQVLISTSRLEHDQETLVYEPTSGEILASFTKTYTTSVGLVQQVLLPAEPIRVNTEFTLFCFGQQIPIPQKVSQPFYETTSFAEEYTTTRITQASWLGFSFPVTIVEKNTIGYESAAVLYTQEDALALARLSCSEMLYQEYPDAVLVCYQETLCETDDVLTYQIEYTVIADICL